MTETNELVAVVAHFLDGKVVKGLTRDFFPNRPAFHLYVDSAGEPVRISFNQLKALFFVRDLTGDSARQDIRGFIAGADETRHGKKIAVRFPDGELVCGYTLSYSPRRPAFFIHPDDAGSNNTSVFVNVSPGTEVGQREAAVALAQRVLDSKAA